MTSTLQLALSQVTRLGGRFPVSHAVPIRLVRPHLQARCRRCRRRHTEGVLSVPPSVTARFCPGASRGHVHIETRLRAPTRPLPAPYQTGAPFLSFAPFPSRGDTALAGKWRAAKRTKTAENRKKHVQKAGLAGDKPPYHRSRAL